MILSFELSMPGANSWNGKWSGEGKLFAKVYNLGKSQKAEKLANEILKHKRFMYHWDDGWSAAVTVKKVNAVQARKIRSKSRGFCGYDWMVDSIKSDLKIIAPHER